MLTEKEAKNVYNENITFLNNFFTSKLGKNEDSLYLAHKTISNAIINYSKYKPIDGVSFKGWLKRVAHNSLLDHIRKEKQLDSLDVVQNISNDSEEYPELFEFLNKNLPESEFKIFQEYYVFGKTLKELSIEYNTDIKAIKNRIYYIKKKIKNKLNVN